MRKGNEAQPALGETYVLTKGIGGVEADVREGKYRNKVSINKNIITGTQKSCVMVVTKMIV